MINEEIEVTVSGLGDVDALADALDKAAESAARLDEVLGRGFSSSSGATGADKLAASYDGAFARIQAGIDKLQASMAKLGDLGGGADAAAGSLGKIADAEKVAAAQADAMASSVGKADDAVKGLGDTTATTTGGLGKLSDAQNAAAETGAGLRDSAAGVSDGLKVQADQTAALTALQADMADSQKALTALSAEHAAVMADSSAQAAAGQRLNSAAYRDASAEAVAAQRAQSDAAKQSAADAEASAKKHELATLGVAAAIGYGVDKAAQLQAAVTRLYTSAGESKKNLPLIEQGILSLAPQTATSQAQLAQGAYYVESAGIHGQNALNVLKAVAEGAYAEGAPLGDVANAATSIINAYGIKPTSAGATSVVNQMLTAVGQGKMTMAGLSGALPTVLPTAAAAGISLPQILGSMAGMTAMGTSPENAAQETRHTITALQKPSSVQAAEMQMLGINPVELSKNLGKEGLTGTIEQVDDAIKKHMGPGGLVMLDTLNQSKLAAQSANEEIAAMPPAIKGVAQAYLDGTVTAKQFNQEIFSGSESARDKALLQQFQTTASNALGFSAIVKAGLGDKQTVAAALNEIMGGQVGQQVALLLGGSHLPTTTSDVGKVHQAAQQGGTNVQGWGQVQGTLKFQLGAAEQALESTVTQMGKVFLPAATAGLKDIAGIGKFFASNSGLTKELAQVGGGLAALMGVKYVGGKTVSAAQDIGKMFGFSGIGKSSGLDGAAAGLDGAAGRLSGAASELSAAAGRLGESGLPGGPGGPHGTPVGTSETTTATTAAEETAPVAGLTASSFLTGVQRVLGPAAVETWIDQMARDQGQHLGQKIHAPQARPDSTGDSVAYQVAQNTMSQIPVLGPALSAIEGLFGVTAGKPGATPHGGGGGPTLAQLLQGRYGPEYRTPVSSADGGVAPPPAPTGATGDLLGAGGHPAVRLPGQALAGPTADLLGAGGHPGTVTIKTKIEPPDAGSLTGFNAMLAQAIHAKPVKLPAPDLSALTSARGTAAADGAALSAGFAAGIASGQGAAVSAAQTVANAAANAMRTQLRISSPSKVTQEIGSQTVQGLIQGLEGGTSNLQNATQALIGTLANPDAVSTIQQTIQQLVSDLPSTDSGLVKWLGQQQTKLTGLANQQGKLMSEISNAQQIATSQISAASITGAAAYTPAMAGGPQSSAGILTGLGWMAGDTKQFASQLAQLQKMGLNATFLSQLAQGGASADLPITSGLLTGGKGAVSQANTYESQILKSSQQIGNIGGPATYQAQLAVSQGLAPALKSELAAVGKAMTKVADAVVGKVDKATGAGSSSSSSSSSTAGTATASSSTAGTGGSVNWAAAATGLGKLGGAASGAAGGLDRVAGAAGNATGALARIGALAPAPSSSSGGGHGGGGSQQIVVHSHIHLDGAQIATVVNEHNLAQGSQNWQAGLILPGKHT